MLKLASYALVLSMVTATQAFADGSPFEETPLSNTTTGFRPFTGKVSRERVRLRLQPSLDSPVFRELEKGEMLAITAEEGDFYAIKPPSGTKAYVYRTYILDGVVEGNKVNVRIEPHIEAPVLGQLTGGERIDGKISPKNSKWLEVDPPATARFYVATNYIERAGDASYLSRYEDRQTEVNNLLNSTYLVSQQEIQKPFPEIEPNRVTENFRKVLSDYPEFEDQVCQAKDYLSKFEDAYLHKKVSYLEDRSKTSSDHWKSRQEQLNHEMISEKERAAHLEQQLTMTQQTQQAKSVYDRWMSDHASSEMNAKMALWIPVEIAYYEEWAKENPGRSIQDFYKNQKHKAVALRGILEPYERPIKNKPGDYLLVNRTTRQPIAYVYSTQVNLHEKAGNEITLEAVLRPNNNFAYPAYFILSAQ